MSHSKGRYWERVAGVYLESLGWEIIARNYTVREGELDLVVLRNKELAFVEVKMRSTDEHSVFQSINARKKKALLKAAEAFLSDFDLEFELCYFILLYRVEGKWEWMEDPFDCSS
ncbi:MAG: hypothetical protein CMK59_03835 [Proteobacteria bacterium]|nr:hypothetical protein [Pseudomonadota bacterium]